MRFNPCATKHDHSRFYSLLFKLNHCYRGRNEFLNINIWKCLVLNLKKKKIRRLEFVLCYHDLQLQVGANLNNSKANIFLFCYLKVQFVISASSAMLTLYS